VKEHVKGAQVVGVDPIGSILAGPGPIGTYKVEGIGYDFIPDVLDRSLVDEWVKTEDRESFLMARRLIRQEGMLVGGSSGSAVWAALQIAKKHGPKKRIVTILPDSVRNYMTKFLDDRWMRENGFTEAAWETCTLGELLRAMPARKQLVSAASSDTVADAVMAMKEHGISQLPVLDEGRLVGIVTESDLLSKLVEGASLSSAVAEVMFRNVRTVQVNDDARVLTELFVKDLVALVVDEHRRLLGILTKMDLVDHLTGTVNTRREGAERPG
jgi:cystathionine beta-synthase